MKLRSWTLTWVYSYFQNKIISSKLLLSFYYSVFRQTKKMFLNCLINHKIYNSVHFYIFLLWLIWRYDYVVKIEWFVSKNLRSINRRSFSSQSSPCLLTNKFLIKIRLCSNSCRILCNITGIIKVGSWRISHSPNWLNCSVLHRQTQSIRSYLYFEERF